jgi:hypothetical protein
MAMPKMKAESITSNEWVAEPSTMDKRRIQPISYMNDERPVPNDTARNSHTMGPRPPAGPVASAGRSSMGGAEPRSRSAMTMMRPLMAAATMSVPGRPSRATSTKPDSTAPMEAPRLLVK